MENSLAIILLGIIQGLTEFLPVSSSGHLVLAQSLIPGFTAPPAAFDVLLHGGTLLAVLAYFWRDIVDIVSGLARPGKGGWRLPAVIIVGSVPVGIVGVFFSESIEGMFRSPMVAAGGLLVTGILLLAASKFSGGSREIFQMGAAAALFVGIFQALAIVPGISRSGSTICAAMLLGFSGTESARFSFLLSIPAVAGALFLEAGALAGTGDIRIYAAGAVAAAITGWLSIAVLMRVLARGKLLPFALYCLVLGSLSMVFLVSV